MTRILNKINNNSVNILILLLFLLWAVPVLIAFLVVRNLNAINNIYNFMILNIGALVPGAPNQLSNLLAYAFLHAGPVHLVLNLISLSYLGNLVAQVFKPYSVIIIYVVGAIVAGIFSLLLLPYSAVTVGASGAIFAFAGALLASTFKAPRYGPSSYVSMETLLPIIVLNLVIGFAFSEQVNNVAHVAGLVSGFAIGYVYPNLENLGTWWHKSGYKALNYFSLLLVVLTLLSIITKILIIILN